MQHICINIDNNFVPQAAALMASVYSNAIKEAPPVFHVLSNGVSTENELILKDFAGSFGGEAFFHELGDFEERLEAHLHAKPETGRFPKTVLARIFAAEYLSSDIDRFLYLDADMIVRTDISGLFDEDITGYVIGACPEPTIYEGLEVDQGEFKAYFNAGMFLCDRNAWINGDFTGKALNWYCENNGKFDFADQDILNNALLGKVKFLSQKWNFMSNYHYQSYDSLVKRAPWYGKLQDKAGYNEAQRNPFIVHFAGDERPWYKGNRNPYRDEFYKYLEMTPFKDMKPIEGKERYMSFYHAVNVVSEKIPGFRTFTSRVFYKVKMKK